MLLDVFPISSVTTQVKSTSNIRTLTSSGKLQRRLKSYDVSRKYAECNIDAVVNEKRALLDGPECMGGYRFFWQRLKMKKLWIVSVRIKGGKRIGVEITYIFFLIFTNKERKNKHNNKHEHVAIAR